MYIWLEAIRRVRPVVRSKAVSREMEPLHQETRQEAANLRNVSLRDEWVHTQPIQTGTYNEQGRLGWIASKSLIFLTDTERE